jgi:hypothetical protein
VELMDADVDAVKRFIAEHSADTTPRAT